MGGKLASAMDQFSPEIILGKRLAIVGEMGVVMQHASPLIIQMEDNTRWR